MNPSIEAEIAARIARIDPALGARRAAVRLIAIGHSLIAAADRGDSGWAVDLLIEGAALCAAATATERFAAALAVDLTGEPAGHRHSAALAAAE